MKVNNYIRNGIVLSSVFLFTTGFMGSNPESEVANFIRTTESSMHPNKNLDFGPLPEVTPYEPFAYQAKSSNPFLLQDFVTDATLSKEIKTPEDQCRDDSCGDGAPVVHAKYFLENYELGQLTMVGTLDKKNQTLTALIKTPNAGVVETKEGEYMGKNYGLIIAVKPDHIIIREKHQVPRGWQNRMAILELFN